MLSKKVLDAILTHYQVGELSTAATRVATNSLHESWQLHTPQQCYFLKKLNSFWLRYIAIENYQASESLATYYAQRQINTVAALQKNGLNYFYYDNAYWLLYPWVIGTAVTENTLTIDHIKNVAVLLAKLHACPLPDFDIPTQPATINTVQWSLLYEKLQQKKLAIATLLKDHIDLLPTVQQAVIQSEKIIVPTVAAHGDFTPKNILWQQQQAVLIDWELAHKADPFVDLCAALLDWCLQHPDVWNKQRAEVFLENYQTARGKKVILNEMHLLAALKYWLLWLYFNLERRLLISDETAIAVDTEIKNTLESLAFVMKNKKNLIESVS